MSTIYTSSFSQGMAAGQGRHRDPARMRANRQRWMATLAAFIVAVVALSGGLTLLTETGMAHALLIPVATLLFVAGAAFVIMVTVVTTK